jgi:NAD(P)-dependent dehydrogenase (short-subunit alcohol dehydrogenase family)
MGERRVMVVVGASSGLGRATALEAARRGWAVVVAARRRKALDEVVREIEDEGGQALGVTTDVTDPTAVDGLARQAIAWRGTVDAWVNVAAVSLFERFEGGDANAVRRWKRVVETNLFGYVHGIHAILPHFRERGEGVIVNVSSISGRVPQPYTSAYSASKAAVTALGDSLQSELRGTGIRVATVLPASFDTPLFHQAANHSGRAVKPLNPVNPPEMAAVTIVRAAERPRGNILTGVGAGQIVHGRTILPSLMLRWMAKQTEHDHFQPGVSAPPTDGNLYQHAGGTGSVSGGWRRPERTRRVAAMVAAATGAVAGVAGIAVWRRHSA